MNRTVQQQKGFSLLEVLIGLLILSVAVLAMMSLQISSVKGNTFSHYLTQGTYVAQDRLELLSMLPFDAAALQPGSYEEGAATRAGMTFERTYTVAMNGDLKTIHYTVRWNDGVRHQVTFSTARAQ